MSPELQLLESVLFLQATAAVGPPFRATGDASSSMTQDRLVKDVFKARLHGKLSRSGSFKIEAQQV